jgi:hypothetical protein
VEGIKETLGCAVLLDVPDPTGDSGLVSWMDSVKRLRSLRLSMETRCGP